MVGSFSRLNFRVLIPDIPTEIDPEVDFDSRRAVYFRQMRYGLFVSIPPRHTSYISNWAQKRFAWLYLPVSWLRN